MSIEEDLREQLQLKKREKGAGFKPNLILQFTKAAAK